MLVQDKPILTDTKITDRMNPVSQLVLVQLHDTTESYANNHKRQKSQIKAHKVPSGVTYLYKRKDGNIFLSKTSRQTGAIFILEPIFIRNRSSLLIICISKYSVWINGQLAPLVAIAKEKDEVFFEQTKSIFQVFLCTGNRIGLCPEAKVGNRCPICRKAFNKSSIIYLCHCGLAVHAEKTQSNKKDLTCINLITECLDCGRSIKLNWKDDCTYVFQDTV